MIRRVDVRPIQLRRYRESEGEGSCYCIGNLRGRVWKFRDSSGDQADGNDLVRSDGDCESVRAIGNNGSLITFDSVSEGDFLDRDQGQSNDDIARFATQIN